MGLYCMPLPVSCGVLATCRELVREGSLSRGKSNFTDLSERYVFLLTDILLVAQVGGARVWWVGPSCTVSTKCPPILPQPLSLRKKAYRLKDQVPLVQAWITDQLLEGVRVPENGQSSISNDSVVVFVVACGAPLVVIILLLDDFLSAAVLISLCAWDTTRRPQVCGKLTEQQALVQ